MTSGTGQPGREERISKHDIRDRTLRTGYHGQQVQQGQDSRAKTAGSGQPGQDNRERTTGTGQSRQDNRDRAAGTDQPTQVVQTGKPGPNRGEKG
jgi:hypothetical protein